MRLVEAVGKRIEAVLRERNLTPYRVAKDGGFPRQTIAEVVQAKNKTVALNVIYQITDTIGISLSEFFNDPIFEDVID